eukprot:m51a1_g1311 putative coiled-coil domain-containing protein 94 homolog (314) ;mRNA; r:216067-217008
MGERKVLNKYYPPDFDVRLIPRMHREKDAQCKVRMMLPMSIQCKTCGEYIYKGKKFNSRKETVEGEDYLGIKVFRFYMRCTRCCAEFTIKTDPRNSDYICEQGATRNYEPWREKREVEEEVNKAREEEDKDAMKALENKTADMKQDVDVVEALEEIKDLNARNTRIDPLDIFAARAAREQERDRLIREQEDLEIAQQFGRQLAKPSAEEPSVPASSSDGLVTEAGAQVAVKKEEEPEGAAKPTLQDAAQNVLRAMGMPKRAEERDAKPVSSVTIVSVKPAKKKKRTQEPAPAPAAPAPSAALSALGGYGDDSD